MAEYIEKGALQASLLRKKRGVANGRYTEGWNDCLMRIKSIVSCFPTADVAPVVRCKDCKHFDRTEFDCKGFKICPASGMDVTPEDYCSYADRKDDNAT